MYQPPIYEYYTRKLHFLAKKRGLSMVTLLNAIVATAVKDEPEPPADERYLQSHSVGVELGKSRGADDFTGQSTGGDVINDSERATPVKRSRRSRVR